MARPLSSDPRDRVVAMVRDGASVREVAKAFSVSLAGVVRWSQRERATGNTQSLPFGHCRGLVLLPQREWLMARLAAASDLTVRHCGPNLKLSAAYGWAMAQCGDG